MSLERVDASVHREDGGYSFSMRIVGTEQSVRVFVADDALVDKALLSTRARFDGDEQAFEEIASERHSHGRVSAEGLIEISLADLARIID
ncbi:hypothetical protein OGR47_17520 [Methylocystis sp. MJC1]|jgi:hypothetical protein|uniref:hypothetical protein n=1 Tax=Methylocystis sp. MJC1 TaxID=2654282 RepID=UPI0013EAD7ED|nr:hypothetical protein [Methylocystis sp. MJC1]KAF2990043.1 hypothetical protein MJC1_02960 [Methylocystis sp. MJC1]MBU6528757.1 hypothetical protein [Methylocystis sp. MJC1]UZX11643.1 hypothetical protein OGR47_17520 [Methylocystis sp. MJC1]